MPQTRGFKITGNRVLLRELRHCIHSHQVKKKQGNRVKKCQHLPRKRDIDCTASIHIRLERRKLTHSHPLEINIKFTHNHVINSAESLSFRRVKSEVREKLVELFKDGHSPASGCSLMRMNCTLILRTIKNCWKYFPIEHSIRTMILLSIFFENIARLHLAVAMENRCLSA